MNEREEKALRDSVEPIANEIKKTWIKAIVLRVKVHLSLAISNGAEPEDLGEVMARAIESAQPITQKFFDDIGEVDKANAITSAKD